MKDARGGLIHSMHSKNILGQIDTQGDNADDFPLLTV